MTTGDLHARQGPPVTTYRCSACGNKTRFDVVETKRVRSFVHFTLGGEARVEEEEVLDRTVEQVVCRWCGSAGAIETSAPSDRNRAGETGPHA
jgi:hypothetical protein